MNTWLNMRKWTGGWLISGLALCLACGGCSQTNPTTAAKSGDESAGKPSDRAMAGQGLAQRSAAGPVPMGSEMPEIDRRPQSLDEGVGPGLGGDQHDIIDDNPFLLVRQAPLSTFSVDVDTAAYAKVRSYLLGQGRLPRKDAVRIEELVNYFDYTYQPPTESEHPFATHVALADCPWNPSHRLARVAIKGAEPTEQDRRGRNLVFLVDVSGSMDQPNKLPLLQESMSLLIEQLDADDSISLVVYAGAAGVVLDGARGNQREAIEQALRRLAAGGSTNGGAGIRQAYSLARDHFIEGGQNRVILCSDGDFNVGTTGTDALVRLIEEEAKSGVFLTVLGFGMGNHNDAMLEHISGRGNGNYFFIDTLREARKVLIQDMHGTLQTIAKDVKIQIEFNPQVVAAYRLIGYENRILAAEDFNDDAKDAGEIGAGHRVTALYEIVPQGVALPTSMSSVDPLRYQRLESSEGDVGDGEWMTIKLRYKLPDAEQSRLVQFVAREQGTSFEQADKDLRFAAAVASFGMLLRQSPHRGNSSLADVLRIAEQSRGEDPFGFRNEFCDMVRAAQNLSAM